VLARRDLDVHRGATLSRLEDDEIVDHPALQRLLDDQGIVDEHAQYAGAQGVLQRHGQAGGRSGQ
jgi:hypothetical protein